LLLAACAASLILAGTAAAVVPGENGRVAFVRVAADFSSDLVTIAADGTDEHVVSDAGGEPAWSPDGTRIAFSVQEIHVMNADGSGAVQLFEFDEDPCSIEAGVCTFFGAQNPTWSPDGTRIAYEVEQTNCGGHDCFSFSDGIWIVDVATGDTQQIATNGRNPSWSPDGTKIAFDNGTMFSRGDIFLMNADGSQQVNLTNTSDLDEGEAAWSPDGGEIAFSAGPFFQEPRDVYVMAADGSAVRQLTYEEADDSYPAWAPDGTKIVFQSSRDGGGLFTMNPDGSNIALLTAGRAFEPDWGLPARVAPRREDFKNDAKFCKAERKFLGESAFTTKYRGGANAYGRCVSSK
jgi:Tol biopolymer transport system component